MSSRNASASILTVGWAWTNRASGPDAKSMTPTAMTTAAIMIATSSTIPTAVSTESSENTMSSRTIWTRTLRSEADPAARSTWWAGSPSSDSPISVVAFQTRNRPPLMRIRSRHDSSLPGDRDDRRGQPGDPRDRQQEQDAHPHREAEADDPGAVALVVRQPLDEDRDEDDVVDAEHDLEHRQRQQGDPRLGVGQQLHGSRIRGSGPRFGVPWPGRDRQPNRPAPPARPRGPRPRGRWRDGRSRPHRAPRARRAGRRASGRVPARRPEPAAVPPLDARLPDEPERLGGDGRPPAARRLRGGDGPRGRRPGRHQHVRHPRGRRAEGHRPAGPARAAQGGQPGDARGAHRLLGPRARSRGPAPPLPGRRPVPAPGRGARAGRPARAGLRAGADRGDRDQRDRGDHDGRAHGRRRRRPSAGNASPGDRGGDRRARLGDRRLAADHLRLRQDVHLLHRAVQPRPGAEPPVRRRRRRGACAGGRRLPRGDAARPERQLVRPRPRRRSRGSGTSPPSAGPAAGSTSPGDPTSPSSSARSTGCGRRTAGRRSAGSAS